MASDLSFKKLLRDQLALQAFEAFAVAEYSPENIKFYKAVEEFKQVGSDKTQLKERAMTIFRTYIDNGSECEINIDLSHRQQIKDIVMQSEDLLELQQVFNAAQIEVVQNST